MRNIFLSLLFGIVCNLFVIEAKNSLVSDFVVSREENPKNTVYIKIQDSQTKKGELYFLIVKFPLYYRNIN